LIHDEIRVDVGNNGFANTKAFELQIVDQFACAASFRVFEGAARAGSDRLAGAALVMGGGEFLINLV
jgi:hypothetical protein